MHVRAVAALCAFAIAACHSKPSEPVRNNVKAPSIPQPFPAPSLEELETFEPGERAFAKLDQNADLVVPIKKFLTRCFPAGSTTTPKALIDQCYAPSAQLLLLDRENREIRIEDISSKTSLDDEPVHLGSFEPDHSFDAYHDRDKPNLLMLDVKMTRAIDGQPHSAEYVLAVETDDKHYRVHRLRTTTQAPVDPFTAYVLKITGGHTNHVSLKDEGDHFSYDVYVDYLKGHTRRWGTLTKDGRNLSSHLESDYCLKTGYEEHDPCYERKISLRFDPKSHSLKHATGHYLDRHRTSGKTLAAFKIGGVEDFAKAQAYAREHSTGADQLGPLFKTPVPREVLKPTEWYLTE